MVEAREIVARRLLAMSVGVDERELTNCTDETAAIQFAQADAVLVALAGAGISLIDTAQLVAIESESWRLCNVRIESVEADIARLERELEEWKRER